MNEIQVTVRGNVATEPRYLRFDDGDTLTSFRLASNERYFDRERDEWVDKPTTFVTVNCRRGVLASNVARSVRKGHPVMVTGRLRERFWTSNERSGQTLLIDADTLGHDLAYGVAEFARLARAERRLSVDQPPTDVTGLTVLEDDVAGAHDAELLEAGEPDAALTRAEGLPDPDDDDEEQDESAAFGGRRPDPVGA